MRPQNINREKDADNEVDHEELTVTDDPVVKEKIYFNIFKCGKNILNKLDVMCEQACMATPIDKYYT